MVSVIYNNWKIKLFKNKINVGLLLLFLLCWIIVGFNTKMSDTGNYLMFYEYACRGVRYAGIELGFYLFMRICAIMGLDYFGFLKVYSFLALYLIFTSINLYSKKPMKCVWLFLFFPFFHIIVAVRNFMSCAIIIYSIRFLWEGEYTKKNIMFYVLGVVLAATFHSSALFYLIFLFAFFNEKKIHMIVVSAVIFGILYILFGSKIYPFLITIMPKLKVYLSVGLEGTKTSTKLFLILFYGVTLFFCSVLRCYSNVKSTLAMRKVVALSIFIMIFSLFNMNFMRLQYNIMIIFSVYVFNTIHEAKNNGLYSKSLQNITILYYIFYFIAGYFLLYLYSFKSIVLTVLMNNSLL